MRATHCPSGKAPPPLSISDADTEALVSPLTPSPPSGRVLSSIPAPNQSNARAAISRTSSPEMVHLPPRAPSSPPSPPLPIDSDAALQSVDAPVNVRAVPVGRTSLDIFWERPGDAADQVSYAFGVFVREESEPDFTLVFKTRDADYEFRCADLAAGSTYCLYVQSFGAFTEGDVSPARRPAAPPPGSFSAAGLARAAGDAAGWCADGGAAELWRRGRQPHRGGGAVVAARAAGGRRGRGVQPVLRPGGDGRV